MTYTWPPPLTETLENAGSVVRVKIPPEACGSYREP